MFTLHIPSLLKNLDFDIQLRPFENPTLYKSRNQIRPNPGSVKDPFFLNRTAYHMKRINVESFDHGVCLY